MTSHALPGLLLLPLAVAGLGFDDPPAHPSPSDAGRVASASPEPSTAMAEIRLPKGVGVELFAAEPLLANPVAFTIDHQGRFYAIETFRHTDAVTDNREHMYWLDADLAARTVEDRVAMYLKFLPNSFGQFSATEDRLRLIVDKDGDGKADSATVFAEGFSSPADGIAAGVLVRKDDVYLASIPSLWLLKDTRGVGKADVKKELQTGYGVHVAFLGHDLHGLSFGPDGRLYFSIGDRGLNVKTTEGTTISNPDSGAILRCEPDGSKLEIYAVGLRNPQELAFDDRGNLFSVDNNSDSGDKARVVHLVEGGDSGWRIGYQYMEAPTTRGPWNSEMLWYPRWEGQAAYIVPPLFNLSDGPSGLTREPGVSLMPDAYKGRFFLADFRGAHGTSGIRTFSLKPSGASFEVGDSEQFIWSVLATDVDFGPDGALYVSDWVDGWRKTGKGRIWKFADPSKRKNAAVAEVKRLLSEGMSGREASELSALLAHADRRVRQEAQFELADRAKAESRGDDAMQPALKALRSVARKADAGIARLHAVWALGQVGRSEPMDHSVLIGLLNDPDADVKSQAAKTLGDLALNARKPISAEERGKAREGIVALLENPDAKVRSLAVESLGKLGDASTLRSIQDLIVKNADQDAYLRHAAVVALGRLGDPATLAEAQDSGSASLRLATVLALRRLKSAELARFLSDPIPSVVAEAARAIYEAPVDAALEKLAALEIKEPYKKDDSLMLRVVAANERQGGSEAAARLAAIGRDPAVSEPLRLIAFDALAHMPDAVNRDRVNGLYRPLKPRGVGDAARNHASLVPSIGTLRPVSVRSAAIEALAAIGAKGAGGELRRIYADKTQVGGVRLSALKALDRLGDAGLAAAVTAGVDDRDQRVRSESHRLLAKLQPEQAIATLGRVWRSGTIAERQNVAAILGGMARPEADVILIKALVDLAEGKLAPELELDVREAAARRASNSAVKASLAAVAPATSGDPLAGYLACLKGGDAENGQRIFKQSTAVECMRCHRLQTKGGEVGPELTKVGEKHDRRYLLEAIVAPNKAIAEGFESVVVAKNDGTIVTGVLRAEDDAHLRLMTSEGKLVVVPKAEIEERRRGPSAMPEDLVAKLSKSEIRDLVEFLFRQK